MKCEKLKFRTLREARRFAKALRKINGKGHARLYGYRCRECQVWHLTRREAFVTRKGINIHPALTP